jgi:hypothetical protein
MAGTVINLNLSGEYLNSTITFNVMYKWVKKKFYRTDIISIWENIYYTRTNTYSFANLMIIFLLTLKTLLCESANRLSRKWHLA